MLNQINRRRGRFSACRLRLHAALSGVIQDPGHIYSQVMVKMRLGGESNRSVGNIIGKSKEDYRALHHNAIGGVRALA